MSTDLQGTTNFRLTRFYGGQDRGTCVQVTQEYCRSGRSERSTLTAALELLNNNGVSGLMQSPGFVEMTREQALELGQALVAFGQGVEVEEYEVS